MTMSPSLLSRIAAALFGGYVLSNLLSLALAGLLPLSRADTVLTAMQLSFVVYVAAVVWVFSARSAGQAWAGLLLPSVVAGLAWLMLRGAA